MVRCGDVHVEVGRRHLGQHADDVRHQHAQTDDQHGRPLHVEPAETVEAGEREPDAEQRDPERAGAEQLPERVADVAADRTGEAHGQQRQPEEQAGDERRERAEPAAPAVVGGRGSRGRHTATVASVTRRSWKMGKHRVGVRPRCVAHVVAEAESDELAARAASAERPLPALAVAAHEVEGRERGVVEAPARGGSAQRGRHQPSRGVGVVQRERALAARADHEHRLVALRAPRAPAPPPARDCRRTRGRRPRRPGRRAAPWCRSWW